MIQEVKTFKVTCDRCRAEVIVHGVRCELPKDWGTETSSGWGMTDYTRTEELCPLCLRKIDAR
jgi:hypothetical protein